MKKSGSSPTSDKEDPDEALQAAWMNLMNNLHSGGRTPEEDAEMRSVHPPPVIITKVREGGSLPAFVALGHRHLEKAPPTVLKVNEDNQFVIPVDLLGVTGVPEELQDGIEEITLGYRKA